MNLKLNNYLISPLVDFMMLGGIALFTYIFILTIGFSSQFDVVFWMFFLAFFVNSPHFMISYEIFYKSFLKKGFVETKLFFERKSLMQHPCLIPLPVTIFFGGTLVM